MYPGQAQCLVTTNLALARGAGVAGTGVTTRTASILETIMHRTGALSNKRGYHSMGNLLVVMLPHSPHPRTALRWPLYTDSRMLDIPAYLGWALTRATPFIKHLRYVVTRLPLISIG